MKSLSLQQLAEITGGRHRFCRSLRRQIIAARRLGIIDGYLTYLYAILCGR